MEPTDFDEALAQAFEELWECTLCGSTDRASVGCYEPPEDRVDVMRPSEWPPDMPLSFLYAICHECAKHGAEAVAAVVEDKLWRIAVELREDRAAP
jgi:hypothetical protein